jgi:hypothetical protein
MLVSKSELERRLAVAFLGSIGLQEQVTPLPAGSGPDFMASLDGGVVGLELTRIYREDHEAGVSHREAEGRWDQVLVGAYDAWNGASLPAVTVYVSSIPGVAPEKSAVPRLVHELVSFVAARVPPQDASVRFEREWTGVASPTLPDGIAAVDILRPSYHDRAYWFMPRSGMVPDLSTSLLQSRISVKNRKFLKYSSPPTVNWLVLVVEGAAPSSVFTFAEDALEHNYESVFAKTFLFDAFSRRTFELRTSR